MIMRLPKLSLRLSVIFCLLACLLYGLSAAAIKTPNLKAGWRFETSTITTSIFNIALTLEGTSSYLSIADAADLSFGTGTVDQPFSVSAWVYPNGTGNGVILAKDSPSSANREWLVLLDSGTLSFKLLNADGSQYSAATLASVATYLTAGAWHHVVCTYDGRGGATAEAGMKIFIDNEERSLGADNSGSYAAMTAGSNPLTVGYGNLGTYWPARLAEVRLFSGVLSTTEVAAQYNSGNAQRGTAQNTPGTTPESDANTKLYFKLDDGSHGTAADFSGNNHSGTLHGF